MFNPIATYRLQFHKEFSFQEFESIISYLKNLGVSTIYAAPILESVPGSTHGYDGVNPHRINPEIGTEHQLKKISSTLKEAGMQWLQDIVPNHMAYHHNNPWLMDVLEKGPQSIYISFFDVTWTGQLFHGRLMAPFLGAPLEEVIDKGDLKITYRDQRLVFQYFDSFFPLSPYSYTTILQADADNQTQSIVQLISEIPETEDAVIYHERWQEFRLQLAALMNNDAVKTYIEGCFDKVNADKELLHQIANKQSYRLCYWLESDTQINYRRFFTVNGLICLNIQDDEVFQYYHQYIKVLLDEGIFQGLRIDHIDGLYNPTKYLQDLRKLTGEETYIVVEKIIESEENLPKHWPIQGTTGYDFLSIVNNLFTQNSSEKAFTQFYQKLVNSHTSIQQQLRNKKALILYGHMGGELENLYKLLLDLNLLEENVINSITPQDLKKAIAEFLIECPVYRYYGNHLPLEEKEAQHIQDIFNRIKDKDVSLRQAVGILEEILIKTPQVGNATFKARALEFYQRCMQFTGPLMAKGVEDTLMYTYNRFIGHNEVGDTPKTFGYTEEEFHQKMIKRQQRWPLTMNATATHDTKRGEDVHGRLNVLTDLPDEWLQAVQHWQALNKDLKQSGAPDANDEYFIYQTLISTYPVDADDEDTFKGRLEEYLQKALREAKRHSNWRDSNEAYETAATGFATSLLNKSTPFWKSFEPLHQKVARFGMINSLSQLILKFMSPGIPDIYQGTELWDLSLVDPDNRRLIDYEKRQKILEDLTSYSKHQPENLWRELWKSRSNAQIKLWLMHTLFNERKLHIDLFSKGAYIPLPIEGNYKKNVLAFARNYQSDWYIVAVALHPAELCKEQGINEAIDLNWKNTCIVLPEEAAGNWEHRLFLTSARLQKTLQVQDIFHTVPFALLKLHIPVSRAAGILMHITSLPAPFGIGDMGPEAMAFADFLHRTHQKYWQLLPLNPIEEGQFYSPYSSVSSMAGNTLLISPELLAEDGLLNPEQLPSYHLPHHTIVDFKKAKEVRDTLFQQAWNAFQKSGNDAMQQEFSNFCATESGWLNDFALYTVLKEQYNGAPWFHWPEPYKQRQEDALERLTNLHTDQLDKIKWLQFIFSRQWKNLKAYCNQLGIQLFGDLPFYIGYDSADVWSNREIFCLNEEGGMTGQGGVPPDAFSDEGQLWGMPVFRWDVLKSRQYDWWIDRLKKNMELFDLVRLDHFRAFAEYWEVPEGAVTAKNGAWMPGPGADLFKTAKKQLGSLPFIAEDLGVIDDKVYKLRDEFNLPGMKILQFAFDDDMDKNPYLPHNYTENFIVYTGTHDNNTVLGWYHHEGRNSHRQLAQYAGREVSENTVNEVMADMAYASVAKTVILPMQDVLGLNETARMNKPSSTKSNWSWRLMPGAITPETEERVKTLTQKFHRL